MKYRKIINTLQLSQGSSLLEVMVSLFVLAIGMLGALSMQTQAMQHNQSSYSSTQAIYFANDIAERIRANAGGDYTISRTSFAALGQPEGTAATVRTIAEQRTEDLKLIKSQLDKQLPQGAAQIEKDANGYTISIFFNDSRNKTEMQGTTSGEQTYKLKANI